MNAMRVSPNYALHLDAPASLSSAGVPSLASSLGAGERGRSVARFNKGFSQ
jgi:hypothetical protein